MPDSMGSPGSGRFAYLLATIAAFHLAACDGGETGVQTSDPLEHQAEVRQAAAGAAEPGETLYLANCAACHQKDGTGLPGAFPPLAGSDYIDRNPDALLEATIRGLSGPITVNGEQYDNVMPAMAYLSDEELATLLSWIQGNWGNNGTVFTPERVAEYRESVGLGREMGAGERHPGTPEAEQGVVALPSQ